MKKTTPIEVPLSIGARLQSNLKTDKVRHVFENVPSYVNGRQLDIRMRVSTVGEWAATVGWKRLLDIGCGSGAISLPLLSSARHLTLLDLSESMLNTVRANVPGAMSSNVEIRNEDFMAANFEPRSFDLVVCVGVLAHVVSPTDFIKKIAEVLRPGGSLILAFTDSYHLIGRIARFTGGLKELMAPAKYPVNLLSFREIAEILARNQLRMISKYRYAEMLLPGIERIVPPKLLFKISRLCFGTCSESRNGWLGNEYICLLANDEVAPNSVS